MMSADCQHEGREYTGPSLPENFWLHHHSIVFGPPISWVVFGFPLNATLVCCLTIEKMFQNHSYRAELCVGIILFFLFC